MKEETHVVSVRLPEKTYRVLMQKSVDWNHSISTIIRSFVIEHLMRDDIERAKIQGYKTSKKSKRISAAIANGTVTDRELQQ